jgi:hypothetical protein
VLSRSLTLSLCVACACLTWASAAAAQDDDKQRKQEPAGESLSSPPDAGGAADKSQPGADLRTAERWGAVAFTADGAFGAAYGIDSKEDAERLAIGECQRESTDKQDCARGVVTRQDSWFQIQFCQRDGDVYTHITTRRTLVETNQAAAQFARTSKYGLDSCRLLPNGLFHSGGLHARI